MATELLGHKCILICLDLPNYLVNLVTKSFLKVALKAFRQTHMAWGGGGGLLQFSGDCKAGKTKASP